MAISLETLPDMADPPSTVPSAVVEASIGVLVFSLVCLASSILLIAVIYNSRERWNYVHFMAIFASISTAASIVQQIYYPLNWANIKQTKWEQAHKSTSNPAVGYGPLSQGVDLVLYWIQFYCYSVNSLFILFWAVALVKGVHQVRLKAISDEGLKWFYTGSKIFAITFPGLSLGIAQGIDKVYRDVPANLIITNGPILSSLIIGSISVITILLKYLSSRALFASFANSSRSCHTTSTHTTSGAAAADSGNTRPQARHRLRIDKWIIFRFSAAFAILSIFMICIVVFQAVRYTGSEALAQTKSPDWSTEGGVSDVLQFLPGVTSGLLAFLLFGTTAQYRARYVGWFRKLRCGGGRPARDDGEAGQRRGRGVWDTLPDDAAGVPGYQCTIEGGGGKAGDNNGGVEMAVRRPLQAKGGFGAVNVSEEVTVQGGKRLSAWDSGFERLDDRRPLDGQGRCERGVTV